MNPTQAREEAERIAGIAELEVMAFRSQDPEALDRLNQAMVQLRDNIQAALLDAAKVNEGCELLANTSDTMSLAAWDLVRHEYGEQFSVKDTDSSQWANKVRRFCIASDTHLDALEHYRQAAEAAQSK